MTTPISRRVSRKLTVREQEHLHRHQEQIAADLPDLIERNQMRDEARSELTLSGELRRAVHGSSLSLSTIAGLCQIPPLLLDEFLTGERTLRSDVLDRIAAVVGFALHAKE